MRILVLWCLTTTLCSAAPLRQDAISDAQRGVDDLIENFWIGTLNDGHFDDGRNGTGGGIAELLDAVYGWWKITGSPDALARMQAHWKFLKNNSSISDYSTCGASSSRNIASDDTGGNAGILIKIYLATRDQTALTWAKAALDCARARWHDNVFGGGFWYNDAKGVKSNYSSILIMAELDYYAIVNDVTYLFNAIEDEEWVQSALKVRPETSKISPIGDNLYWLGYGSTTCDQKPGPQGCTWTTKQAYIGTSYSMLSMNMATAIADARLYRITGRSLYLTQAVATSLAIQEVETNAANPDERACSSRNVFTDDRDAKGAGWVAYEFAAEVVPLLPSGDDHYPGAATFLTTAKVISSCDRNDRGQYGGDFQGPVKGNWSREFPDTVESNVSVSGSAVSFLVAATLFVPRPSGE